jgi:hypothetical protein
MFISIRVSLMCHPPWPPGLPTDIHILNKSRFTSTIHNSAKETGHKWMSRIVCCRANARQQLATLYIERKMLQPDFWFWILVVALQHPWVKNAIWTIFFTKAKGTLPPEKGHFLCFLKTWGGLDPPVPTPLYVLGTLIWLGTVRICI